MKRSCQGFGVKDKSAICNNISLFPGQLPHKTPREEAALSGKDSVRGLMREKLHLGEQKKEARRKKLLAALFRDPGIMIRDLAEALQVSRETIRRDLDALCARGELQRRYGGAVFAPAGNLLSFDARQDRHLPERRAIAAKAQELLQDGQVIMLGPGTTALLFAAELAAGDKHLTVITNGLREALTLGGNERLRVVLAPGELDRLEGFSWGQDTSDFISRFNADLAIIFADGLTAEGLSEADPRTVWTIRAMQRQAASSMLLMDHHRFGRQGAQRICALSEVNSIVSDLAPPAELAEALEEQGVTLHLAPL